MAEYYDILILYIFTSNVGGILLYLDVYIDLKLIYTSPSYVTLYSYQSIPPRSGGLIYYSHKPFMSSLLLFVWSIVFRQFWTLYIFYNDIILVSNSIPPNFEGFLYFLFTLMWLFICHSVPPNFSIYIYYSYKFDLVW